MGGEPARQGDSRPYGTSGDTNPYRLEGPSGAPNVPNFPGNPAELDDAAAALRLPARAYTRDDRLVRYAEVNKRQFIARVDQYVATILADPTKSEATREWAQDVQNYAHSSSLDRDFERWMGNYQNKRWNDAIALEQELRKAEGYLRSLERVIGVENLPGGKGIDERFAEMADTRAREAPLVLQRSTTGQHFVDLPDGWTIKVANGSRTSADAAFSVDISGGRRRYYLSGVNANSIIEITNSTGRDPFTIQMGVRPHGNRGDFVLARAIGNEGRVQSTQPVGYEEDVEQSAPPAGVSALAPVVATAVTASRFRVPFSVAPHLASPPAEANGRVTSTELAESSRASHVPGAVRQGVRGSITVSVEGGEIVVFDGEIVPDVERGGFNLRSPDGRLTPCEVDISNARQGAKVSVEIRVGDQVRTSLGEVALDAQGNPYVKFNPAPEAAPRASAAPAVVEPARSSGPPRAVTEGNGPVPPEQTSVRPAPQSESTGLIRRPGTAPEVRPGQVALPEAPTQSTAVAEVSRPAAPAPQPQAGVPVVSEPVGTPSLIASTATRPPRFAWMESVRTNSVRLAGNPHFQNTALLVGLVGVHNAVAGDYRPDAQHDLLPQFTRLFGRDALTDDFLAQAWGVDTNQTTRETGIFKAWAMDTAGGVGDGAAIYAILYGSTKAMGLTRFLPHATIAATPFVGYSFTAGGAFIHRDDLMSDLALSTAVPTSGAALGGTAGLIGGPASPITVPIGAGVGAILATGGATVGMFTAVGNVIEQNKESIEEGAVRDTLARAEQGWERGPNEPNNPISEVARNYIDKLARADFMQRAILSNTENGTHLPFSADNWPENWENVEAVIQEIKDYRDRKSYWFGSPLSRFSASDRDALVSLYSQVFEESDGMLKAATRGYQRTFLIERQSLSEVSSWGAFWGYDKSEPYRSSWDDAFTQLGTDFEQRFRAREQQILALDQNLESTKQARADLQIEEIGWLRNRFPRISDYLMVETNRNILEKFTSPGEGAVRTRDSFLMQSFAVSDVIERIDRGVQMQSFYAELDTQIQSPAFQEFLLNTLSDERGPGEEFSPRQRMSRHFSGEERLSDEELGTYLRAVSEFAAGGQPESVVQLPPR